jgi:hypothetical protein
VNCAVSEASKRVIARLHSNPRPIFKSWRVSVCVYIETETIIKIEKNTFESDSKPTRKDMYLETVKNTNTTFTNATNAEIMASGNSRPNFEN